MIYLIHFSTPVGNDNHQAQHYLGYTENLEQRVNAHRGGTSAGGARLLEVCSERGVDWDVVRLWFGDRELERRLKRWKKASRLCPICSPRRWDRRANFAANWRPGEQYLVEFAGAPAQTVIAPCPF